MKKKLYLLASIALSLSIHAIFLLVVADKLTLSVFSKTTDTDDADAPRHTVLTDVRDLQNNVRRPQEQINDDTLSDLAETVKQSEKIRDIFEEHHLVEIPKPKLRLTKGRDLLSSPKPPEPTPPRQATAPRPEIVSIDGDELWKSPERLAVQRPFIPKVDRQNVNAKMLPSLVHHGELKGGSGKTFEVGMRLHGLSLSKGPRIGDVPIDGSGQSRASAFTGQGGSAPTVRAPALPVGLSPGADNVRTHKGQQVHQLDKLMAVSMVVYPDRAGGGFFRVDISPNPRSERLRPVSKDIMFLIDCSNSISPAKLKQFKEAVAEALPYLTKRDGFNIISFRERAQTCFPSFMPVTDESVAVGEKYVRSLQRGGMTDVFAGLAPAVESGSTPDDAFRPLNVFLMSDGQSTVKDSLANDVFIRKIVEMNRKNVSIYSFSAGKNVNRFLLDFLAYHNRGLSLHQEQLKHFRRELVEFIGTHASLIVSDLKYHIADGLDEDVFPKRLPHLYRGETLSVYGRYPKGAEEIAVSVTGRDIDGNIEELIFRGSIADAGRDSPQLALDWAAQKIFHLIGLRTLDPSPQIQAEIRQVAQKYNLYVPY